MCARDDPSCRTSDTQRSLPNTNPLSGYCCHSGNIAVPESLWAASPALWTVTSDANGHRLRSSS